MPARAADESSVGQNRFPSAAFTPAAISFFPSSSTSLFLTSSPSSPAHTLPTPTPHPGLQSNASRSWGGGRGGGGGWGGEGRW